MANIQSAEKRNRQNIVKKERNHARIARIRTFVAKVEKDISAGDASKALLSLRAAQSESHRGVSKGNLHKNTVSRKISRLHARIKGLA